jgi:hypothetical protein
MNISELKTHMQRAIDKIYARDLNLFGVEACEWALAHRLAVYLEHELPEWNVDCEYNRQGDTPAPKMNEAAKGQTGRVRSDIIIHHRTQVSLQHNLLVVELKMKAEADDAKVAESTTPPDDKRPYQYQYGLALSFLPELKPRWYANGVPI